MTPSIEQLAARLDAMERANAETRAVIAALRAELSAIQQQRLPATSDETLTADAEIVAPPAAPPPQHAARATVGYENGLVIEKPSDFSLRVNGTIQAGYVYDRRRGAGADAESGFEVRRAALRLSGYAFDPSWTYLLQGDFAGGTPDGNFGILDAVIGKRFENGLTLEAGRFRLPFNHEQLTSFNTLLAVERSLVAGAFGVGRAEAVQLKYAGERVRAYLALSDGLGSIVGTSDFSISDDVDYAVTGRVEALAAGSWSQFNDFVAWPSDGTGLMFGAAIHRQEGEIGTSGIEGQVLRWTADATLETHRLNAHLALSGDHTEPGVGPSSLDQLAFVAQGGYLVTDHAQLFSRYEWAGGGPGPDLSVVTAGATLFFNGKNLRFTADAGLGLNPVGAPFASSVKGFRADPNGEDGQLVLRALLQLSF